MFNRSHLRAAKNGIRSIFMTHWLPRNTFLSIWIKKNSVKGKWNHKNSSRRSDRIRHFDLDSLLNVESFENSPFEIVKIPFVENLKMKICFVLSQKKMIIVVWRSLKSSLFYALFLFVLLIDRSMDSKNELIEKRFELRQNLKKKLLTLSPSFEKFDVSRRFLPNFRENDFIENQGLDEVLNYLNNETVELSANEPFSCEFCRIDATEIWWRSFNDENRSIFLCDQCEQNRTRRIVVQQHRESMKSAFLQAKETERKLEFHFEKQNQIRF